MRFIDVFIDELDLSGPGFKTMPEATAGPGTAIVDYKVQAARGK